MFTFLFFIPVAVLCLCICIAAFTYMVMGFKTISGEKGRYGALVAIIGGMGVIGLTLFVYFKYCWFFSW